MQKNVILVLIVLVLAGVGGYMFYQKKSGLLPAGVKPSPTVAQLPTSAPVSTVAPTTTSAEKYPPKSVEAYPATFRSSFLQGCVTPKSSKAYCECTYDWIQARFTLAEFITISQKVQSKEMPQELIEAVAACAKYLMQ